MKVRSGFVSNSSSSSFIATGVDPEKLKITIDLAEYGTFLKTPEDLEKCDFYLHDRKEVFKLLQNGITVFVGHMDREMIGLIEYIETKTLDIDVY